MTTAIIRAIDQQPAHAAVAHFGEGDFLRAVGHRARFADWTGTEPAAAESLAFTFG